jgi:2-polyprenyl-6-methoxyphenol hydroxylase-like FAD-dependent oxidoreductase
MTTALLLAQAGVETMVIEERGTTAARSYACALHPHTLEVFDHLGLVGEILGLGHRVDTVAFYDGSSRRAEVKLMDLPARFPFLVVLPQSVLEDILVRALRRQSGVEIKWHHRLSHLQSSGGSVAAAVDKLGGTSVGYIVPHWEMIVQNTTRVTAQFLVGADGHGSLVRRCLGIDFECVGEPELFAVFEFETDTATDPEVRVVLDANSTNVLWPLPGGRCRWSFQLAHAEAGEEFPHKDRRAFWINDPDADRKIHHWLQRFIEERAPWFRSNVREFDWVSRVQFERRLAKQFGDGQCWLVGDAAHQTGPVGMQSVNVGLREAEELVATVAGLLKASAPARTGGSWNFYAGTDYPMPEKIQPPTESFESWNRRCRERWRRLLGLNGPLEATATARVDDWVIRRAERILPCLPASGDELDRCLKQLGLEPP